MNGTYYKHVLAAIDLSEDNHVRLTLFAGCRFNHVWVNRTLCQELDTLAFP